MSKFTIATMKDLKEKTSWVHNQVQKHRFVVLTKRGRIVAVLCKISNKDLQLAAKAHKRIGL